MTGIATPRLQLAAELSTSIGETETAVIAILDAVDHIVGLTTGGGDDPMARQIRSECMRIREACTFQDIVGQRLAKVAGALNGATDIPEGPPDSGDCRLEGPALQGEGLSQDDIDQMLEHASA
ncbi:MAG: hypothetical protein WDM86_03635 [Rhizomicrobium sp.]